MYFNRLLTVLILFAITVSNIKGQEKKNLNDSISDNLIKTSSGIEIKIEGPHSEKFSYGSPMSPITLDYMKEIKILKTATLIFKGGGVFISKSQEYSYFGQTIYKPERIKNKIIKFKERRNVNEKLSKNYICRIIYFNVGKCSGSKKGYIW